LYCIVYLQLSYANSTSENLTHNQHLFTSYCHPALQSKACLTSKM